MNAFMDGCICEDKRMRAGFILLSFHLPSLHAFTERETPGNHVSKLSITASYHYLDGEGVTPLCMPTKTNDCDWTLFVLFVLFVVSSVLAYFPEPLPGNSV